MGFDRLPLPLKLGLYALAAAILLYLTLAPSKALPTVNVWDKAEHAIAWAVLAGVGLMLFPRHAAAVAVFALAFGALVEVLQGALPFGRDMDWKDWVADAVGVGAALVVFGLVRRL
ncbi:MAG TPA: VanZ family protein [Phenylobacterium sp.]|jgi:VanZ family protein|nr:VanZ family protein [Phenylobacterium sp.]